MGDWVFGCDICQDVCPVNRKAASTSEPAFQIGEHGFSSLDLIPLLRITDNEFLEKFTGTPIRRAKRIGLVRNVCIALGNMGDMAAVPALLDVLFNAEPLIRGHSAWALGKIGGEEAEIGLKRALALEDDIWAAEELQLAIDQLC
jgi:epoxyqueuosine reductase